MTLATIGRKLARKPAMVALVLGIVAVGAVVTAYMLKREAYTGLNYLYRVPGNMRSMAVVFTQTHFRGHKSGLVTNIPMLDNKAVAIRSIYLPPLTTITLYSEPYYRGTATTFDGNKLVLPPRKYASAVLTGPFANKRA